MQTEGVAGEGQPGDAVSACGVAEVEVLVVGQQI
jgi:hypothetical protein